MHTIHPYTCGTMRVPWRQELVTAVDNAIKAAIKPHWPGIPEEYTKPREEMAGLRNAIDWLHPAPAPDRSDWNGSGHHGDPRYYVPRDLMLIDRCDPLISYIGEQGRNLGGAGEVGYAFARSKRIITIDHNPHHQSYDAWRAMSTSIFGSIEECAKFLLFLIDDNLYTPGITDMVHYNKETAEKA
jgi:nucleoside 2-deoxyribosyltransferase